MTVNEESISIEEIRELALRYIDESECGALVRPRDIFALLVRPLTLSAIFGKKKSDKWLFAGYGLLLDYTINPDEKPYGKWITVKYLALSTFPPTATELRLQPPHIAKGYFQSFDRTNEMKIEPVVLPENESEAEILQFPDMKKD
jgi:hypothetical protein